MATIIGQTLTETVTNDFVSKRIVVPRRWRSETRILCTKAVDKGQITTIKGLRSGHLERQPFVVTFRLDYEDDVSSVCTSSSLSDQITNRTFRALALRRHFPIGLRRWRFDPQTSSSLSDQITKRTFRALALHRHCPITLRRCRFERQPFAVTFRLDSPDTQSVKLSACLTDVLCFSVGDFESLKVTR